MAAHGTDLAQTPHSPTDAEIELGDGPLLTFVSIIVCVCVCLSVGGRGAWGQG